MDEMNVTTRCQNYPKLRKDLNHFLLKLRGKVAYSMKAFQGSQQDHPQCLVASCLFKFKLAELDHLINLKDHQSQIIEVILQVKLSK